jgi:hypothetical protein
MRPSSGLLPVLILAVYLLLAARQRSAPLAPVEK